MAVKVSDSSMNYTFVEVPALQARKAVSLAGGYRVYFAKVNSPVVEHIAFLSDEDIKRLYRHLRSKAHNAR